MEKFDVIVVGSGPAGEKAAAQAAYFGKKVLIIEKEPVVGGAMVNTGTIPSKTLRETSLFLSGRKQRGMYGVDQQIGREITVQDLMFRKNFIVNKEIAMINENLAKHKVKQVRGIAYFIDEHTIGIEESEEKFGGDFILIAVGSQPFRPAGIPFEEEQVYDSDEILQMEEIPESMVIIGAGVIGCEYACMFGRAGNRCHAC
jgi:Pyruvate/2-oxoglutarate dehydrogenase complex, dihydrolipoamide dehydrogenase (E3) component, and related enzymes